jgi:hypothetical protein
MVWRAMFVNPFVVVLVAIVGIAVCRGIGVDPHLHELVMAGAICLFSSELAIVPVVFNETLLRTHQSQAALLGTVVHLLLATMMSAVVFLWLRPPSAFLYWLLAMYWLTLGWLCVFFVRIVRQPILPGAITSGRTV